MIVKHNITAMNSNRMLGLTTTSQAKSTERLSSGYKINRAADDAAGLAISEKMRRQVRGLTQAAANAQDGISAVQTAEGALTEVHDMLQRMNELAVKASNGTMSESDRSNIQDEIDQLVTEIDRVAETTKFNETYLLKGKGDKSATVKAEATIGSTTQEAETIAAKGNIYRGAVKSTLAVDTADTATITYKDAEGKTRTKDIEFKAGVNDKATAKSLADAIAADKDLGKIFNASVDEKGELVVESKLNGNKTDNTKNAVTNIEFKSAADSTEKLNTSMTGTVEAAVGESVKFSLSKADGTTALVAGNSITIDGKTYTYDPDNTTSTDDANKFKNVEELQALLGSNYDVSVLADSKVTYSSVSHNNTDATGAVITDTNGNPQEVRNVIVSGGTLKTGSKATKLEDLALTDFDNITKKTDAADYPKNDRTQDGTVAGEIISNVAAAGFSLNIARKALVDMSDPLTLSLHVGADSTEENKISVDIESMSARSLGIDGLKVDGKDNKNADNANDIIADAIAKVSKQRSALGAVQNRLEHTINNLDNVVENTTSAEAAIRDTDIATEMVKYANNNILQQAGTSMLAQANQSNQLALSLLG